MVKLFLAFISLVAINASADAFRVFGGQTATHSFNVLDGMGIGSQYQDIGSDIGVLTVNGRTVELESLTYKSKGNNETLVVAVSKPIRPSKNPYSAAKFRYVLRATQMMDGSLQSKGSVFNPEGFGISTFNVGGSSKSPSRNSWKAPKLQSLN